MTDEIKKRIEQVKNGKVPEGYKRVKGKIIPATWNIKKLGDILQKVGKRVVVEKDIYYTQIGIRSHGNGLFYKEPVSGIELGDKTVFWIEKDCLIVNIVFAWERAIGKTTEKEVGMIGSHRFPMYRAIPNEASIDYLLWFFNTKRGNDVLAAASPGGAGRNKTLGQKEFANSKVYLPPFSDQEKIAEILTHCDKVIELKKQLITEEYKQEKWLKRKLLTGQKRLPGFNENWEKYDFDVLFDKVSSAGRQIQKTQYQESGNIPIVDQGQNKIIAYSNDKSKKINCPLGGIIVFGDHTRIFKFINFDFIVGADGTQLLVSNDCYASTLYLYYVLANLDIKSDGYSRHFKYIKESIFRIPNKYEQTAIANILLTVDHKIELLEQELNQWQLKKKSLMQLLLTGIVRV